MSLKKHAQFCLTEEQRKILQPLLDEVNAEFEKSHANRAFEKKAMLVAQPIEEGNEVVVKVSLFKYPYSYLAHQILTIIADIMEETT